MRETIVVLLLVATRRNTLQHAATHCNTLQHSAYTCICVVDAVSKWHYILVYIDKNMRPDATRQSKEPYMPAKEPYKNRTCICVVDGYVYRVAKTHRIS